MTPDERAAFADVVRQHLQAEFRLDTDEAMKTVCDAPYYTFEPAGRVIDSVELLREFYATVHENIAPFRAQQTAEQRRQELELWDPEGPCAFWGPHGVAYWIRDVLSGGDDEPITMVSVFNRDEASGLIKGEHIFGRANSPAHMDKLIGPHPDLIRRLERAGGPR